MGEPAKAGLVLGFLVLPTSTAWSSSLSLETTSSLNVMCLLVLLSSMLKKSPLCNLSIRSAVCSAVVDIGWTESQQLQWLSGRVSPGAGNGDSQAHCGGMQVGPTVDGVVVDLVAMGALFHSHFEL